MLKLAQANEKQLEKWDKFVDSSVNGTIFHKLQFLSYHKNKFAGRERFLVVLKGEEIIAQISVALDIIDGKHVLRSPYGASYGGFIFAEIPSYQESSEIVRLLIDYMKKHQVHKCILTHSLNCYSDKSLDTYYFTLLENGFHLKNRDISSVKVFDSLPAEQDVRPVMRRKFKRAQENGVQINENPNLKEVYQVLYDEQKEKFQCVPTHTLEEFLLLHQLFPSDIYSVAAEYDDKVIAALTLFRVNQKVMLTFYICQNLKYKNMNAVPLLILYELRKSQEQGYSFFDFGTSSINMKANPSLLEFKEGFTRGVGMFRETYCLEEIE